MLRSSKLDNNCHRVSCIGFSSTLAISAVVLFASGVGAQEQQKDQSTPAPQQQTQPPPPVTVPTGQQQTPATSSASKTHLPQIVVNAPKGKPKAQSTPRLRPVVQSENPVTAVQHALDTTMQGMDQARNSLPCAARTGAYAFVAKDQKG